MQFRLARPSVMNKTTENGLNSVRRQDGDKESAKMEFGDILFTLVNVARDGDSSWKLPLYHQPPNLNQDSERWKILSMKRSDA